MRAKYAIISGIVKGDLMAIDDIEEKTPSKKRLNLKDTAAARGSLCALMRQYHNDEIDHTKFKNMIYGYSKLLEYDKHKHETELDKRIEALEVIVKGTGKTVIDPAELSNPYTHELLQRLAETEQVKSSIEQRLLETENELKLLRSRIGDANE